MIGILVITAFLLSYFLMPSLTEMVQARLMHFNHANQEIPLGLGMLFIIVVVPLILVGIVFRRIDFIYGFLAILTILSFGFLGLIDDTLGSREARGFLGHFRALFQGQLTTGALKAIFGGIIAVFLGVLTADQGLAIIVNALLIALTANFANLLDVRPGRTGKFYIGGTLVLLLLGAGNTILLLLLATVIPYLSWDLQGKVMMGDVGANILGSILGLATTQLALSLKIIIIVGLLGLHFYAERKSFTLAIENNKFLNYLDLIGRKKL